MCTIALLFAVPGKIRMFKAKIRRQYINEEEFSRGDHPKKRGFISLREWKYDYLLREIDVRGRLVDRDVTGVQGTGAIVGREEEEEEDDDMRN
jgi:hypothetical protein